jgi:catechol 2,3-dioxygenase-like lactoylglutathione lyase family enzyme
VLEIGDFGLTVGHLERSLDFYTRVLPFEILERSQAQGEDQDRLLGLAGARTRSARLRLGSESIRLTEHLEDKGHPVPADSRSFDHWFQHMAIVVADMDRAYARLREHKVRHVSTSPQTLPDWNPAAGGIRAFYFRDPDDHVLEIIWFPNGKGEPRWQDSAGQLFLGIDHTAIVVADTARSTAFYRDLLGLNVAGESENWGVEQEHLNQVFGARLLITGLRAAKGPGIEFLEYITPPGGRPLPPDARATDLAFWQTHLVIDGMDPIRSRLKSTGTTWVSRESPLGSCDGPAVANAFIVRDPDGHALTLSPAP